MIHDLSENGSTGVGGWGDGFLISECIDTCPIPPALGINEIFGDIPCWVPACGTFSTTTLRAIWDGLNLLFKAFLTIGRYLEEEAFGVIGGLKNVIKDDTIQDNGQHGGSVFDPQTLLWHLWHDHHDQIEEQDIG